MKHLLILGLLLLLSTTNTWSQDTWVKVIGGSGDDWGMKVKSSIEERNEYIVVGFTNSQDGSFKQLPRLQNGNRFDSPRKNVRMVVSRYDSSGNIIGLESPEHGWSPYEMDKLSRWSESTEFRCSFQVGYVDSKSNETHNLKRRDIYVTKQTLNLDSIIWERSFGGSDYDEGTSLIKTNEGGVVITGCTQSNDGDFKGLGKGDKDIFIMKLDRNGGIVWKNTFGGSSDESVSSITSTLDGGIVVTGTTNSGDGDFWGRTRQGVDLFLMKTDSTGNLAWVRIYGGSLMDVGNSVDYTNDGGFIVTGYTESNDGDFKGMNKGGQDIFIMKLDKDGNLKSPKK